MRNNILKFDNPERVFVTADSHAFHKNISKGSTTWPEGSIVRDFANEVEMTEQMAANINEAVGANDVLIHGGDWSFGGHDKVEKFRSMINCRNIIITLGNHDHHIENNLSTLGKLFTYNSNIEVYGGVDYPTAITFVVGRHKYILSHYAFRVWNKSHHGVRNLYGHSHSSLPDDPNALAFDVGMDCHGLRPLNFIEVEEIISEKVWKQIDHHNQNTN